MGCAVRSRVLGVGFGHGTVSGLEAGADGPKFASAAAVSGTLE